MTDLSKLILNKFLIRKTTKQKTAFIAELGKNFECTIQSSKLNRNIIIGDVKTAKTVYSAHYDTPASLLFPNFMTPKSLLWYLVYQIVVGVIVFIPIVGFTILFRMIYNFFITFELSSSAYLLLNLITSFGPLVILGLFFYLLLCGPANKSNTNDNTSGVITLIELYTNMSDEAKKECAFVFFDNEEKGLLGSRLFKKIYKKEMKNFVLVNFDCVADGDNILLVHSKKAKLNYKDNIKKHFTNHETKKLIDDNGFCIYPSDNMGFTNSIGICALKHNKVFGYYVDKIHTKHDTAFDEENINYLVERFNNYQESLLNK